MKTAYSISRAIQLRTMTWLDFMGNAAYKQLPPDQWNEVIDFRTSVAIAIEEIGQPDLSECYDAMMPYWSRRKTMTRAEWRKVWRNYRVDRKRCYGSPEELSLVPC